MIENNNINIDYDLMLEKLPNMEDVSKTFRHKNGCSQKATLSQIQISEISETEEGPYHLRFGPRFVREVKKYLVCEECHVQERYYD